MASLKSAYLKRHGIPARLFNAIRVSLDGKSASVREQQRLRLDDLLRRGARAERQVSEATERGRLDQAHQKKRRLANLRHRLAALEADIEAGRVWLCFGSKRLWRKQRNLEANGCASHQEWLRDWREARNDGFFVLGSRDERAGCQLCVAAVADDGTLTLRLRMPERLAGQHDSTWSSRECGFSTAMSRCWRRCRAMASMSHTGASMVRRRCGRTELGQAISYRVKRDEKGWRVFVTTEMMDAPVETGPVLWRHRRGPEYRPSGHHRDRRQRQTE